MLPSENTLQMKQVALDASFSFQRCMLARPWRRFRFKRLLEPSRGNWEGKEGKSFSTFDIRRGIEDRSLVSHLDKGKHPAATGTFRLEVPSNQGIELSGCAGGMRAINGEERSYRQAGERVLRNGERFFPSARRTETSRRNET